MITQNYRISTKENDDYHNTLFTELTAQDHRIKAKKKETKGKKKRPIPQKAPMTDHPKLFNQGNKRTKKKKKKKKKKNHNKLL